MFHTLLLKLRGLVQRRRVARELDDELRFHIEQETRSHLEEGLRADEACRRALRALGGVDQTKEAVRDVRATWLDAVWQDVRFAARGLWHRPGPGLAAVGMLGLGIGLTTAMFTLVDALILRPVPFDEPDELAFVYMGNDHGGRLTVSPAVLRAWREGPAFAAAEGAQETTAVIEVEETVATRGVARVTPGFLDLLGDIQPVRGRVFHASDAEAGDRVLLSEDLWRSFYGSDPAIVGRQMAVDGEVLTVVGVLPSEFRFPSWDTVIWRATDFDVVPLSAVDRFPMAYVRFASSVPREDAARLATEAARAEDPRNAELRLRVYPLAGLVLDPYYARAVPVLAGGVALVFLVLCANVCSLLLARLTARQGEFGMRSALGASRARLAQQTLVESSLMALLSVLAGTGIAWLFVSLTRAYLPEAFLLRTLNPLNLDGRALGVTSALGVVAVVAAGLLPAWIGTRIDLDASLRVSDRTRTEPRVARVATRALLVGEVALSCALLVGAVLLVRSFVNLAAADRGLDTHGVISAWIGMPAPALEDPAARAAAARAAETEVRELPGVQQLAWSFGGPPDGGVLSWGDWHSDAPGAPSVNTAIEQYYVGAEFFELYRIPLLRGRAVEPSDPPGTVVVGERLARMLWPGLDPVGRGFAFEERRFQVVGIAREIHHPAIDARLDRPEFYEPFGVFRNNVKLSIRCSGPCPSTALVRQRLMASHPDIQVYFVQVLDSVYDEQLGRPRAAAVLSLTFAAVAMLASVGGLFSVLSYAVSRRRREFGVRAAMGASPGRLQRLVLGEGVTVAIIGVALGGGAAWVGRSVLDSLQYGVTATDPLSWTVVLGLLACATVAGAWLPARLASRADPARLLRQD